jgi:hypothetical protein
MQRVPDRPAVDLHSVSEQGEAYVLAAETGQVAEETVEAHGGFVRIAEVCGC